MKTLNQRVGFGRARARLLAGSALCVAMFVATAGLPALAATYTFSTVKIEGNTLIEPATILKLAGIAKGAEVSDGALNDAAQRLTDSGLFATVEVVPSGGTLIIRVTENPTINVVDFEGNKRLKDEVLAEAVQSKSRRVYSASQAEADAAAIADAYSQAGRLAARVEPRVIDRGNNQVDLVFEIREGKVTEVERLTFTGNRAFSDRRLRQVLETKQAGIFRSLIQRDTFVADRTELDKQLLVDFYRSRGFIDATVLGVASEFSRERDAFFLTFNVREGQRYSLNHLSTLSEVEGLDPADFAKQMRVRSGVTYSPNAIDVTVSRMEALALKKGLDFVSVEPRITRNERDQTLDVAFVLVKAPRIFVERIDIQGNATTLDKVVRRQFHTVEGDPFNPREIKESAERIRALGFFKTADVQATPGTGEDRVIVDVNVEEQPTGSLSFGATYSVANGVGVNIGLSESNFLGRGQYLSLNIATAADNQNNSLTFIEPNVLDRNLKFRFETWYNTTDNDNSFYATSRAGISPSIEFPLTEQTKLELRYKFASDEIKKVSANSSPVLAAEAARGAETTSALGYTLTYDTRIVGLNPNSNVVLKFGQDFAGLGGDIDTLSTTASATYETKILNEEVTLHAELEGGVVSALSGGTTRLLDRFTGNSKIRGFKPNGIGPRDLSVANQDALGGNMFAAARLEARFPVGLPEEYGVTGGIFADVGSVWGLDNPGAIDDSMHLRSSVGFSIFWDSAIGPLRFNFSRALNKETYDKVQNFDLSVSTKF